MRTRPRIVAFAGSQSAQRTQDALFGGLNRLCVLGVTCDMLELTTEQLSITTMAVPAAPDVHHRKDDAIGIGMQQLLGLVVYGSQLRIGCVEPCESDLYAGCNREFSG